MKYLQSLALALVVILTPTIATASGTITGGVRRSNDSTPVSGVTITFTGPTNTSTITGTSGAYVSPVLANGTYSIVASKSGRTFNSSYSGVVVNNAPVYGKNFIMYASDIMGGIRDGCEAGSVPVAGISVSLTGPVNATTNSNASGVYIFSDLPNGTYHVHVYDLVGSYSVYSGRDWDIAVTGTNSTGNNVVVLPYRTISGGVRTSNDDAPVQGVTITFAGPTSATVTSDANGYFQSPALAQGAYTITPSKSGRTFNRVASDNLGCAPITGENFIMYNADIYGGVRDGCESGSVPVGGVTVTLTGPVSGTAVSDGSSGVYRFYDLPNGSYHIHASDKAGSFTIGDGRDQDVALGGTDSGGHNVLAMPYRTISGGVRTSNDDAPVQGVTITFAGPTSATVTSDANGYFQSPALAQGAYTITPSKSGRTFNRVASDNLGCAPITGENFIMYNADIYGGVRDGCESGSVPVGGVTVTLTGPVSGTAVSDGSSGVYRFYDLPNGSYHIHASDKAGSFTIGDGRDQDVALGGTDSGGHNVLAMPYRTISGFSESFETELPVANDRITITNTGTGYVTTIFTNEFGLYLSSPLPQGMYTVGAGSCCDIAYFDQALGCDGLAGRDFRQRGLVDVTGLSATGGTGGSSIRLIWDTGTPETISYRLFRSSSKNGPWEQIYEGMPPYILSGLECGEAFYFRVAALNACEREGAPSAAVIGRNDQCLLAPVAQVPPDGATVALPELFCWTSISDAESYEFQLASDMGFSNVLWSSATALTSLTVPASVAPPGSACVWRVRATSPEFQPGSWSSPNTLVVVSSTAAPGAVALLGPSDGESYGSSTVLFQWMPAAGATSYKLEISAQSDFAVGATLTSVLEGIVGTTAVVTLSPVATSIFWRVSAKNNSGYGPLSSSRRVDIQQSDAGVVAAAIISPARDFAVEQGQPVSAYGLVVGRAMGTIIVEWLLDETPIATQSMILSGTGSETDLVAIPTGDLGSHIIEMRVNDGTRTISAPTRLMEIVAPGFGEASSVIVVPDRADLVASESTPIYCTIRDADGSIVLNDNGRLLHVATTAYAGSVSPSDIVTSGGIATAFLTAGNQSALGEITVEQTTGAQMFGLQNVLGALAVSKDGCWYSVSTTELSREKKIAEGYCKRLQTLDWAGVEGAFNSMPLSALGIKFNMSKVIAFVNQADASDIAKLRRLNLILRLYDRGFSYNEIYQRSTPREAGRICGAATLWVDATRTLTTVALGTWSMNKSIKGGIITRWLAKAVVTLVDKAVRWVLDRYNGDSQQKYMMQEMWGRVVQKVQTQINANPSASIGEIMQTQLAVVGEAIAPVPIKLSYINTLQGPLDRAVDIIGSPTWDGGSDADADAYTQWALREIRATSNREHAESKAVDAAFRSQFVNACQFLAVAADVRAGSIVMKTIEGLIKGAQGIDCEKTALDIANFSAHAANVLAGSPTAVDLADARRLGFAGTVAEIVESNGRRPMAMNSGLAGVVEASSTHIASLEGETRALELAVQRTDTEMARIILDTFGALEATIGNQSYMLTAPLLATNSAARLDIENYDADLESMDTNLNAALIARLESRALVWEWLQTPNDEALRSEVLSALRAASDETRIHSSAVIEAIPGILGVPGEPFLVIEEPSYEGPIVQGEGFEIRTKVWNLGSGTASNVRLILSGPSEIFKPISDIGVLIGDLAAGDSQSAGWRLRLLPMIADSDSVAYVTLTISPDSASGSGLGRILDVEVAQYPIVVTVPPDAAVRGLALQLSPNPSSGQVDMSYTLPRPTSVRLEVFDVAGRRVFCYSEQAYAAGVHQIRWDGRATNGQPAAPGIYFVRLSALQHAVVSKMVLVR